MRPKHIRIKEAMLKDIAGRFYMGIPMSLTPQMRREGRYAPFEYGRRFNMDASEVRAIIEEWIEEGVLRVGMNRNKTGLEPVIASQYELPPRGSIKSLDRSWRKSIEIGGSSSASDWKDTIKH